MRPGLLGLALLPLVDAAPARAQQPVAPPPRIEVGAEATIAGPSSTGSGWAPRLTVNVSRHQSITLSVDRTRETRPTLTMQATFLEVRARSVIAERGRLQWFSGVGAGTGSSSYQMIGWRSPYRVSPSLTVFVAEAGGHLTVTRWLRLEGAYQCLLGPEHQGARITFSTSTPIGRYPPSHVDVSDPVGDGARRGLLVGAGVAGLAIAVTCRYQRCSSNVGPAFVLLAGAMGTSVGTIVGAFFDSLIR
jgi:hypothetical protein